MTTIQMKLEQRRGHSMMEMMIVMSVLAGMAAMSYPMLRSPLGKLRLQAAGQEVATELAKARVKAMQSGVAQVFRVQLHTGKFQVMAAAEADEDSAISNTTKTTQETAAETAQNDSIEHSPMSDPSDYWVEEKELPEGIVFEVPVNDESQEIPKTEIAEDDAGWTDFAVFYPDGGTTSAVVELKGDSDICLDVKLSGLTGVAKIGEAHRQELR